MKDNFVIMNEEIYNQLSNTVKAQIEKLNSLDIYTSKHIHSTASITKRICKKLNLNDEYTKFCVICAYLHDIGKIFIPSSILQKKDKLSDSEYEIMKKHTIYGFNLCSSLEPLRKYSRAAKSHHENKNGTGYPERISGKEIPLEVEIIKIADIYDSLISKRQYKEEYSKIKAVDIINDQLKKGNLDKNIVKVLFEIIIEDIEDEISTVEDEILKQSLENDIISIENILKDI